MHVKLNSVCCIVERLWLDKIIVHPEIMGYGGTFEDLEDF